MNKSEETTREKIILATINCIERDGLHSVTIRKIAQEAQVNVAAINYHFRSKENLLNETQKYTLNSAFSDWEEMLENKEKDLRSILEFIGKDCLQGAIRYPGVTKAHFYNPFIRNDYQGMAMKRLLVFLNQLLNKIKSLHPQKDETKIELSIMQYISAIFFPALLPDIFRDFSEIDFQDPEKRDIYVKHLIDNIFQEY